MKKTIQQNTWTKENVLEGYNGIIPLDLNYIDPMYHKETIKQHLQEIKLYQMEQDKLPVHLKYENTVGV